MRCCDRDIHCTLTARELIGELVYVARPHRHHEVRIVTILERCLQKDPAERYREIAGEVPEAETIRGRLAYTGYDVTHFLLGRLSEAGPGRLAEAIQNAPPYQGLGLRIDFENNVNEALYLFRYGPSGLDLVR